ncbi:excisionase family DNA binding protein [Paenibacillus sp. JGP012]|uniref:helix-turn-helix domain-containing protein n=1 Tax=Paenibacillus sp. JGP012 TaxID=2735914 RepID=UPI00160CFE3C|nr:helix-turn-helix domain-containing protein [Paenibacillus sp. JGP012]MBB6020375.1 excisionase family DNA binding protein [Paenibacillus sp. JGP012]
MNQHTHDPTVNVMETNQLLTISQLCEVLQTSRRNIEKLRKEHGLPFYSLSPRGHPRFDPTEVKEWMRRNSRKNS